eukprot:TRINITY_DN9665_c0_g1_i1.p1 TRINITY_DN9665_c0_g1~~TRINITY_DN9665_c0_g1_i1.p1  ORF type:complete len:1138 (-),score=203.93 TRINITY_DN9665_c0_g1_i1:80-3493(-)
MVGVMVPPPAQTDGLHKDYLIVGPAVWPPAPSKHLGGLDHVEATSDVMERTVTPEAYTYFKRIIHVAQSELEKLLVHKVQQVFDPVDPPHASEQTADEDSDRYANMHVLCSNPGDCQAAVGGSSRRRDRSTEPVFRRDRSAEQGKRLTKYIVGVLGRILVDFNRFAETVLRWKTNTDSPEELVGSLEQHNQRNTELELKCTTLSSELRDNRRAFLRERLVWQERLRQMTVLLRRYGGKHGLATAGSIQHDVTFFSHEQDDDDPDIVRERCEQRIKKLTDDYEEQICSLNQEVEALEAEIKAVAGERSRLRKSQFLKEFRESSKVSVPCGESTAKGTEHQPSDEQKQLVADDIQAALQIAKRANNDLDAALQTAKRENEDLHTALQKAQRDNEKSQDGLKAAQRENEGLRRECTNLAAKASDEASLLATEQQALLQARQERDVAIAAASTARRHLSVSTAGLGTGSDPSGVAAQATSAVTSGDVAVEELEPISFDDTFDQQAPEDSVYLQLPAQTCPSPPHVDVGVQSELVDEARSQPVLLPLPPQTTPTPLRQVKPAATQTERERTMSSSPRSSPRLLAPSVPELSTLQTLVSGQQREICSLRNQLDRALAAVRKTSKPSEEASQPSAAVTIGEINLSHSEIAISGEEHEQQQQRQRGTKQRLSSGGGWQNERVTRRIREARRPNPVHVTPRTGRSLQIGGPTEQVLGTNVDPVAISAPSAVSPEIESAKASAPSRRANSPSQLQQFDRGCTERAQDVDPRPAQADVAMRFMRIGGRVGRRFSGPVCSGSNSAHPLEFEFTNNNVDYIHLLDNPSESDSTAATRTASAPACVNGSGVGGRREAPPRQTGAALGPVTAADSINLSEHIRSVPTQALRRPQSSPSEFRCTFGGGWHLFGPLGTKASSNAFSHDGSTARIPATPTPASPAAGGNSDMAGGSFDNRTGVSDAAGNVVADADGIGGVVAAAADGAPATVHGVESGCAATETPTVRPFDRAEAGPERSLRRSGSIGRLVSTLRPTSAVPVCAEASCSSSSRIINRHHHAHGGGGGATSLRSSKGSGASQKPRAVSCSKVGLDEVGGGGTQGRNALVRPASASRVGILRTPGSAAMLHDTPKARALLDQMRVSRPVLAGGLLGL